MTIKRLTKEPKENLRDLWGYCFYSPRDNAQQEEEDWNRYYSILDLENCLGYYVNDELVSTYVIISYRMFVRGFRYPLLYKAR